MNRSEDDSLDQARTSLGRGTGGYLFKMNRARVERGVARAEATTLFAPEDYTFRQLAERFVEEAKPVPSSAREWRRAVLREARVRGRAGCSQRRALRPCRHVVGARREGSLV
jgi:hypothetical protein